MPSFSRNLEESLHRAVAFANQRKHEYATLEHLLLSLIDDTDAAAVMRACDVDLAALKKSLTHYVDSDLKSLVVDGGEDAKPTAGFQRVIQRAVIHVQSSGRDDVTGANVLVAIFSERESHAAYFLQKQEMTRYDAVNFIAHGIAKKAGASEARPTKGATEDEEKPPVKTGGEALEAYCINLNEKARQGEGGSADRPHQRGGAVYPDPLPAHQEQSVAGGRPRGGQDGYRRGAGTQDRHTSKCRTCWPRRRSSASTWALCWPAPAIGVTSRSE